MIRPSHPFQVWLEKVTNKKSPSQRTESGLNKAAPSPGVVISNIHPAGFQNSRCVLASRFSFSPFLNRSIYCGDSVLIPPLYVEQDRWLIFLKFTGLWPRDRHMQTIETIVYHPERLDLKLHAVDLGLTFDGRGEGGDWFLCVKERSRGIFGTVKQIEAEL